MKLSSLDIRKQQFSRIVRGYDRDEVDAFLDMVGTQWQELVDEMRRVEDKQKEMQVQLDHYQKVEEALEEAIKGARSSAERKIETAEKSATAILEKAEARSVKITMDAEDERLKIKRETAKYSIRQREMLSKFRAFLSSELEMLSYHENEAQLDSRPASAQLAEASILDIDLTDEGLETVSGDEAEEKKSDEMGGESDLEEAPKERKSKKKSSASKSEDLKEGPDTGQDEVQDPDAVPDTEAIVSENMIESEVDSASNNSSDNSSDNSTDGEVTPAAEDDPAGESSIEPEMSSDSVNGDSDDSMTSPKHRKPSWTVNTLVSPGDSRKSGGKADSDRDAAEPTGDMRAAQEEIDNLRKLLKDLE